MEASAAFPLSPPAEERPDELEALYLEVRAAEQDEELRAAQDFADTCARFDVACDR